MVEEEFRISLSVFHAGISVPQPIKLIDYKDRKGIVYEKITGMTMLKALAKKPWSVNNQSIRMVALHASIHSKNISDLPNQKEILKERIEQAPILTREEKSKIIHSLVSLKEDTKLCHGDFHPDNIIFGDKDWIIDWMTGMTGNPAGDVARTILMIKLGTIPDETPKIIVYLFTRLRNQMLKKYKVHYLENTALSQEEIDQWIVPNAAARLNEWLPDKEKQALVQLIRQKLG
jgi:thiamine kinase-like enzyme